MDDIIKVVICEDHEIFMKGVKHALNHKDDICFIGEAENGMKLFQLLKHVTPDVVLLDINMPIMDGKASLLKLKKEYPNIKVIMLTMRDEMSTIVDMIKNGADAYLVKNCGEEKIYDAIVSCYKTGKYLDDKISTVLMYKVQGKIEEDNKKSAQEPTQESIPLIKPTVTTHSKFNWNNVIKMTIVTTLIGVILMLVLFFIKNSKSLNFLENFSIQ